MSAERLSSIDVPKKVTKDTPIIFILRLSRGTFTMTIAYQVAHATFGRNMSCRISRQGDQDVLTYRIGPRKHWWIVGSKDDLGVINALREIQGIVAIIGS